MVTEPGSNVHRSTGIYFGWWVVLAAFVGTAVSITPIVFLCFGAFIIPLQTEFGWNRSDISLAVSICAISLALALPLAGSAMDRLGTKRIVIPCMCLFAALVASWSLIGEQIIYFYVIAAMVGLVGAGSSTVGYTKAVTLWFDHNRGLALGIAVAGIGAGASVTPVLAQILISQFDWRMAFLGLSLIVLALGLPIVALLLKDSPTNAGLDINNGLSPLSEDVGKSLQGLDRRQAATTREFWTIILIFFLVAMALHGIQIHLIPTLIGKGLSGKAAAGAAGLMGITSLVFRVLLGYSFDRVFAPWVGAAAFSCPIIAVFILIWGQDPQLLIISAFLLGIATGAEGDLLAYLTGRYFGTRAFGELFGYVYAAFIIASAIGPYLMGYSYTRTGSYEPMLSVCILAFATAVGLLISLPKFRR